MEVLNYWIKLNYNHNEKTYTGKEKIQIEEIEKNLVINTSEQNIQRITLNGKNVNLLDGRRDDEKIIDSDLKGSGLIELEFTSKLNEALTGLYLARASDGSEMATTQFESIGARRAFPCFDNPSLKATFDIEINTDSDLDVISNMPEKEVVKSGKTKTVKFQRTPKMSTYLVYIGIGKFETKESNFEDVKLYLSGLKGNLDTTDFPLIMAAQSLEFFNNYFGINYVLPKMHLISVPEFAAGAMENWGAITFREVAILVNRSTGGATRKRVAAVIAHEIAHQWFGNLVTMKWWNDLWLNESFATFMMYKVVENYYPEWKVTGDMLLTRGRGAFTDDSLLSTHPIEANVKEPEEIEQIFDQISYGKGGMILRMIESYVGKEDFRKGLHEYLQKFSYSNAEGADLWRSIAKQSGKPVDKIMESWVKREGYPLLKVTFDKDKMKITQSRFYLDGKDGPEIWPVPLTILREKGIESSLMEGRELKIEREEFIKLNVEETGFYRVLYPDEFYSNLKSNVIKLQYADLIGIMSDLYAFVVSGKTTLSTYLNTVTQFSDSEELNVVTQISNDLAELRNILGPRNDLDEVYLKFHGEQARRLEEKKTLDVNDSILYGTILRRLVEVDKNRTHELASKFQAIESENPDIRDSIAIAYAKETQDIRKIQEKLFTLKSDEDRVKLMVATGHIPGEEAFSSMFDLIERGKIKKQDVASYFTSFGSYIENRELAMTKLSKMTSKLMDIFSGSGMASNLIFALTPLVGLNHVDEIEKLLENMKNPKIERGISKGMERLRINQKLLERLA
ncbi:MAG: M1 family metallopeptidase [Cuniculiplasma sp.]